MKNAHPIFQSLAATPDMWPWRQCEIWLRKIDFRQPVRVGKITLSQRHLAFVRLTDCENNTWLAELAPLPGFSRESLEQAIVDIKQALLSGRPVSAPSAAFCLDVLKHRLWPADTHFTVQKDIPLLQGEPDSFSSQYLAVGCPQEIKLKIGRYSPMTELDAIQQLIADNPDIRLRLDANQLLSPTQAHALASKLPASNILYIEEPCQDIKTSLSALKGTDIKLALDESLQHPDFQYLPEPTITALIIKPSLIGSLSKLKRLIGQAHNAGARAIFSSAYESEPGLGLISSLATQLTPGEPPGLDTARYLCPHDLSMPKGKLLWQAFPAQ